MSQKEVNPNDKDRGDKQYSHKALPVHRPLISPSETRERAIKIPGSSQPIGHVPKGSNLHSTDELGGVFDKNGDTVIAPWEGDKNDSRVCNACREESSFHIFTIGKLFWSGSLRFIIGAA
jgi:hypothetical protein